MSFWCPVSLWGLAGLDSIYSIFWDVSFHYSSQFNCRVEILEMVLIRGGLQRGDAYCFLFSSLFLFCPSERRENALRRGVVLCLIHWKARMKSLNAQSC